MSVRVIRPKIIKPNPIEIQCSVEVDPPTHAEMWRRDRYKRLRPHYDPDRCQRGSTVEIDGKPYCRLHAGTLALDKWIAGQLVCSEVKK